MRWVRCSLVMIGLPLLSLFVHAQVLPPSISCTRIAHGDNPVLSAWASVPPTIDGVIGAEWGSAASFAYTTTGGIDGVFYVMNDGMNLYMAVLTTDASLSMDGAGSDSVLLYFDNDHDGAGPEAADDIIGWTGYLGEGFKDGFSGGTYAWSRDADFGGTSDGLADANNHDIHNHFEIMHPLNTVDDAHDFSLFMSDTVGFAIRLTVDGTDKGWWPSSDPSLWADIALFKPVLSGFAYRTPMIEGKISPAEWDDAAQIDFVLSWDGTVHDASLHVMNDYVNLYLAFEIENEDHDLDDRVLFNFDNDHDGIKWSGDDQISVDGSIWDAQHLGGWFQDSFFPSPGEGPSERDGTGGVPFQNGVGAAQFKGPKDDGSYVFELAHPLNTSDDDCDFSLRVNDTVGFNVLYLDAGGGVDSEAGWPTFTLGEWKEMADIIIEGPGFEPPEPDVNLQIRKIEVTQAIQWLDDPPEVDNSVDLAVGKSTIARVYVDIGRPGGMPVLANVYLYATVLPGASLVQPRRPRPYGPLCERFEAPAISDRGNETHTANFLLPNYWVTQHIYLVAFVKTYTWFQSETDYTDNWMPWQLTTFLPTRSLKIGYYRIDYRPTAPDENPNLPRNANIDFPTKAKFLEKTYPVPDLLDPVDYYPLGTLVWDEEIIDPDPDVSTDLQHDLLQHLLNLYLDWELALEKPHQIIGWIPDNSGFWGGHATGGVGPPQTVLILSEDSYPSGSAHEIGHNLGRPHTWEDLDNPWRRDATANLTQTYGFDTDLSIVTLPTFGDIMSYIYDPRWISPYTWKKLMEALNPGAAGLSASMDEVQSSSPGLLISGVIYRNNTGNLDPVFQTPSVLNLTRPSGPYVVELRGPPPEEPLLYSQSFNVSFEHKDYELHPYETEKAFFSLNLPFMTGAYSVSLLNTSMSPPVLLDKITASPNPPSVTIDYPNGGETVGNSFSINWMASDADGDPLALKLFYSNDNGAQWRPISTRITGTSYQLDASVLPGGSQSLIRVVASDGFHTSEDQSDAVFSVPLKDPMNLVGNTIGPPERPVSFGNPVILKGSAFDPEDGRLNGTALTWTSDLNGTLGTGRILPVTDLLPGIHNITLTATDSHGNTATHSFTVTVELHNITITKLTVAKTVVGQGYTLPINATVENQGTVTQSFNVTVYGSTTAIETTEITLTSGTSTTLTFTWDTNGVAKGTYTIRAVADPVPGETDTTDNTYTDGTVIVAMPCDIAGSTTTPPTPPDGQVDYKDLFWLLKAYGSDPSKPNWDPNCDFAGGTTTPPAPPDDRVDYKDLFWMLLYYGTTDP